MAKKDSVLSAQRYLDLNQIKMQDVKLKIRHAKRGNEKALDLSGMGLSDLPVDITQLTMLEQINLSNNKLSNLRRIE